MAFRRLTSGLILVVAFFGSDTRRVLAQDTITERPGQIRLRDDDGAAHASVPDARTTALRFRDAGNFIAAVQLLRELLAQNPNDGEVARLLAQTLYWLKDIAGARTVYEAALVRHPEDTTVRLQYARMLAETGQRSLARTLLAPLSEASGTRSEAATLLGTMAYWEGDLTTATRFFTEALQANPLQAEAQRQLQAIRATTAPWIRVSSGLRHDDQPLDRVGVGFEAGWFATPVLPVTVRVEPMQYRLPTATTQRLWSAEIAVADFIPAAHLETEFAGGVIQRSGSADATDWQGRAVLGVRLTHNLTLRGRAERAPYLYTTSSLDTPVMTQTGTALLQWSDGRGWLGETAYQQQRYPDANTVRMTYAWLLAPLVLRENGAEAQAGYAFGSGNADQSRFVLANATQPYAPSDPRFSTAGQYVPYYTPDHLVTHSVIAALAVRPSSTVTLRLNGAIPVHATDNAPVLFVSGAQVQRTTYPRSFSPWNARTSLEIALPDGLTVAANGEWGRTAFYSWATADVQLTYRFIRLAPRPAHGP
jgi:tetratricopeptide (TPR) repeat protein